MKKSLRGMKMDPGMMARMAGPEGQRAMTDMEQIFNRYQNKSEGELMEELRRMIAVERAAGNLDDERMQQITGMMAGMLNLEQRRKMEQILGQL